MKTNFNVKKMILVVTAVILSTAYANADNAPGPKTRVKTPVQKTISDYFMVPGFILPVQTLKKETAEKVKVLFTTDSTGKVRFALAQSDNERLRIAVEKRFAELVINDLPPHVTHNVVLSFVLQ
jgi:hypothetical protein